MEYLGKTTLFGSDADWYAYDGFIVDKYRVYKSSTVHEVHHYENESWRDTSSSSTSSSDELKLTIECEELGKEITFPTDTDARPMVGAPITFIRIKYGEHNYIPSVLDFNKGKIYYNKYLPPDTPNIDISEGDIELGLIGAVILSIALYFISEKFVHFTGIGYHLWNSVRLTWLYFLGFSIILCFYLLYKLNKNNKKKRDAYYEQRNQFIKQMLNKRGFHPVDNNSDPS